MKDIRIDNGQLVFPRRMSKDEQAMVRVITPYIQWAIDNGMTSISLGDERRRLESNATFTSSTSRGTNGKSDKESMYGYCQRNSPVHRPYHQRSAETDSKGFIKEERIKEEKYQYIDELVTTINEYNDILALWIKMKQGSLSLNIETFELNELFELLRKGSRTFEMKRQSLEVQPTDIRVKADKALTLFMINTLAENARNIPLRAVW